LQLFAANNYNVFTRWIITLTNPVIKPCEKLLPTHSRFNWACLIAILFIKMIELLLLIWLQLQSWPHLGGLILVSIGDLLYLTANIFFYSIILQAIMSWITMINQKYFAIQDPLYSLTRPLLRPVQRIIPTVGGLDLSAIPVLIGLQLIKVYLFVPIITLGIQLIFS
jgi:YggT family protein